MSWPYETMMSQTMSEILMAIRWWAVLVGLGAIATPLTWALFGGRLGNGRLPSLGYAFAKPMGLLFVSYLFWILGSLGFVGNNLGGIALAILLTLALSAWAQSRRSVSIAETVKANWRTILLTELLFVGLFALWAWVRAQNPSIINTEKPMEFAFLNAIGRSPALPPLDPWLSGFAISYYYFGYVMMSVVARLSAVAEPFAFNLGLAWLFASTGTGAAGLVYDLVALRNTNGKIGRMMGATLGLIAALALPAAGNLEMLAELVYASDFGAGLSAETWQSLDIKDLNTPPNAEAEPRYTSGGWWWWRSSRVISETHLSGRAEEGLRPIHENPAFSFILGDMHPHVLALPYAFLSMALALTWYLATPSLAVTKLSDRLRSEGPKLLLTAVVIGGLSFLNTWDVLIYLFVVIGAYALSLWRTFGRWRSEIFGRTIQLTLLLGVLGIVLYLPFYIGFSSQAGAPFILPMLMRPTQLNQFLVIFGMPLLAITLLLIGYVVAQKGNQFKLALLTMVGLIGSLLLVMLFMGLVIASSEVAFGRIADIANELNINLGDVSNIGLGFGIRTVFALLPTIIGAKLSSPGVMLLLSAFIGLSVMITSNLFHRGEESQDAPNLAADNLSATVNRPSSTVNAFPFILLLIVTASLLTLGPEFVYLKDGFGQRMNTIFKFYYQAWAMFGIAAIAGLYYLGERNKILGGLASVGYFALFIASMAFPFYAVQSRQAEYRYPYGAAEYEQVLADYEAAKSNPANAALEMPSRFRHPATLNGLAYVERNNGDEYAAINWLRSMPGTPVIVEAVGGQYSEFARVAANSGVPTLLGWAGHESQWRGTTTNEHNDRDPIVKQIYTQPNWDGMTELLNRYDVTYIYVGTLERNTYGLDGLKKFDDNLAVAYQNGSVTVYAAR